MWFSDVSSDVGGKFEASHRLSGIARNWMADEATSVGQVLDDRDTRSSSV